MKFWGTKIRDLTTKHNIVIFQSTFDLPYPTCVEDNFFKPTK
jgi:hypothetical protein